MAAGTGARAYEVVFTKNFVVITEVMMLWYRGPVMLAFYLLLIVIILCDREQQIEDFEDAHESILILLSTNSGTLPTTRRSAPTHALAI